MSSLGASHVAFLVEDIEAKKAALEATGIEFYSEVNVVDEGVLAGWRWVYFEDPDGYPLELVEVAYQRGGTASRNRGASRVAIVAPLWRQHRARILAGTSVGGTGNCANQLQSDSAFFSAPRLILR